MTYNPSDYQPGIAIHPGETVKESLEYLGYTSRDFAAQTGINQKDLDGIIEGKAPITPEIAAKLGKAIGTTGETFWLNLQKNYEETLERLKNSKKVLTKKIHKL